MYLSLLYRGPGRYVVLDGTTEVGSLAGTTLRLGPLDTSTHPERAAAAGYDALRRWLASRPGAQYAEHGESTVTPIRRDAGSDDASGCVEFALPPGIYPVAALHVAQGILAALREAPRTDRADGKLAIAPVA